MKRKYRQEYTNSNAIKVLKKTNECRGKLNWKRLSKLLSLRIRGIQMTWSIQWPKPINEDCILSSEPLISVPSFVFRHYSGGVCYGYDGVSLSKYLLTLTYGHQFVSPYNKLSFTQLDLKRLDIQLSWWYHLKTDFEKYSIHPSVFVRRYHPLWHDYEKVYKKHTDELQSLILKYHEEIIPLFNDLYLTEICVIEILHHIQIAQLFFFDFGKFDYDEALILILELKLKLITKYGIDNNISCLVIQWINTLCSEWLLLKNEDENNNNTFLGSKPKSPILEYYCGTPISYEIRLSWINEYQTI